MNRRQLQPYPGLRPFERRESRIFFGRQTQVDDLLQRLKDRHFLAVLGASGSGKSSLVKAGLLAGLEKGYMGEVGASWRIAELRPGDQPFERLAEGLAGKIPLNPPFAKGEAGSDFAQAIGDEVLLPSFAKGGAGGGFSSGFLAAQLRRGSRSLHDYLSQSPLEPGQKLLILADQFEEIFRYRQQSGNQAAAFVALLLEACRHPDIYVVITMRSDFLGEAAAFHGLPEAINDGLYLTPRLTREQLREAIALPAKLFGGSVDEALVNQLLNEAGNNPDQLPLLQHALLRLWVNDANKRLTLAEYQQLDGLRGALDGHLEQVYSGLDPRQQAIAETLFRALTQREADGQDVRRPVRVADVLALAGCSLAELAAVVDAFRGEGRHFLVASTPQLAVDSVLDISHESLIRQWQRLQVWQLESKVKKYLELLESDRKNKSIFHWCVETETVNKPNLTPAYRVPLVSIGLPVYNREKLLPETLGCLLAQTFKDFEIIISDNCSTDGTEQLCREYARSDSRIRYIRQKKNLGVFGNFRFVKDMAQGKYFMWFSSDDLCETEFIGVMVEALEANPKLALVMTDVKTISTEGEIVHVDRIDAIRLSKVVNHYAENRLLFFNYADPNHLYHCIFGLHRTDVAKQCRFPAKAWKNMVADLEVPYLAQVAARGGIATLTTPPLKTYRLHEVSTFVNEVRRRRLLDKIMRGLEIRWGLVQAAIRNNLPWRIKFSLLRRILRSSLWSVYGIYLGDESATKSYK